MKTAILNARIIDPETQRDEITNLYIHKKIITHIGAVAPDDFTADQTLNADQHLLIPGIIDIAVTLREPGQEFKATIESESHAAASAGITHMYAMPEPKTAIDSMAMVKLIRSKAKTVNKTYIGMIGAATKNLAGKQLSNMGGLKHAGCVGVSNNRQPFADTRTLRMAMDYAATYELPLFFHPLDHSLAGQGCVHEGAVSTRAGLPGIPVAAETVAVAQVLALVEELGVRVHLCRLSTANSVDMVRQAKAKGLAVTADVAAHQLFLTDMDVSDFNPLCHVQPPLRSQRDLTALRQGLVDGTIDAICSDHQPHEIDAKLAPFQQTESGISALETLLPLTMRLVEEKILSLSEALACISIKAAKIMGNKQGRLQEGKRADFVLIDPTAFWELQTHEMQSKGKNTPFSGWSFTGKVVKTFVAGHCVYTSSS
jgi:dihydroorotase